jgi:hypothetical protein
MYPNSPNSRRRKFQLSPRPKTQKLIPITPEGIWIRTRKTSKPTQKPLFGENILKSNKGNFGSSRRKTKKRNLSSEWTRKPQKPEIRKILAEKYSALQATKATTQINTIIKLFNAIKILSELHKKEGINEREKEVINKSIEATNDKILENCVELIKDNAQEIKKLLPEIIPKIADRIVEKALEEIKKIEKTNPSKKRLAYSIEQLKAKIKEDLTYDLDHPSEIKKIPVEAIEEIFNTFRHKERQKAMASTYNQAVTNFSKYITERGMKLDPKIIEGTIKYFFRQLPEGKVFSEFPLKLFERKYILISRFARGMEQEMNEQKNKALKEIKILIRKPLTENQRKLIIKTLTQIEMDFKKEIEKNLTELKSGGLTNEEEEEKMYEISKTFEKMRQQTQEKINYFMQQFTPNKPIPKKILTPTPRLNQPTKLGTHEERKAIYEATNRQDVDANPNQTEINKTNAQRLQPTAPPLRPLGPAPALLPEAETLRPVDISARDRIVKMKQREIISENTTNSLLTAGKNAWKVYFEIHDLQAFKSKFGRDKGAPERLARIIAMIGPQGKIISQVRAVDSKMFDFLISKGFLIKHHDRGVAVYLKRN